MARCFDVRCMVLVFSFGGLAFGTERSRRLRGSPVGVVRASGGIEVGSVVARPLVGIWLPTSRQPIAGLSETDGSADRPSGILVFV